MFNRLGRWWILWTILAVIWTLVAVASAWLSLPRGWQVPHHPGLLDQLSYQSASILRGPAAATQSGRDVMQWTEYPRMVRMSNGAQLTFPATTTDERAAFVANEYQQLLNAEAEKQRVSYLLERLAIWLAPLLLGGLALRLFGGAGLRMTNDSAECSISHRENHAGGGQSIA